MMKNACKCCIHDKTCVNYEKDADYDCRKFHYKSWYNEPHHWSAYTLKEYREYDDGVDLLLPDWVETKEDAVAYVLALQNR